MRQKPQDLGVCTATCGPRRATKAEADQDLAQAKQSDSRKGMLEFGHKLRGAPPATSAGRLGNKDDQDKGRIDKVIGDSKGKKRKAEALEDLSQEQKNARANEAAETAMMAAAERDTWRPGVDCFWF